MRQAGLSHLESSHFLYGAEIENYFEGLEQDVECACYASYFAEFAEYFGREGLEAREMLRLLYQSFRALLKPALPNKLVQRIFELKIMVINGEYTEDPPLRAGDSARYAWQYVIYAPIEKLYTFLLKEDAFAQFAANVERNKRAYVDKSFHSLEILQTIT